MEPKGGKNGRFAKFNAGMVRSGDMVHMLYRWSEMREGSSSETQSPYLQDFISYASLSTDGKLIYDSDKKVIFPTFPCESAGCQDPRIVDFEGAYYIFYCAWDKNTAPLGRDKARVAFARTTDFDKYEKIGIIDLFDWDKDAYIFPERINGRIAYVHRVAPNIQIDYFDSFDQLFDHNNWSSYEKVIGSRVVLSPEFPWECGKIGGSVPPIKTAAGWLFLYHGVEVGQGYRPGDPFVYRMGVALLDLKNPSRVLARLPYSILQPEEEYELHGDVNNVVFPCGAYICNDELYISYGAADKYVAMAKVGINELLEELEKYPCR